MYDTLVNQIVYGEYTLAEITERIDTFYAEGRLTADQRTDLRRMAVEHADPEQERWDGLSALYAKGDKVTHGGKTWVSLVDNNCWEPGIIGTELVWKESEE